MPCSLSRRRRRGLVSGVDSRLGFWGRFSVRFRVDPARLGIGLLAILTLAAPSIAQPAAESVGQRAQYVFVVDDSRSMRETVGGEPAADPERLAVFAVRSLLAMLDDRDAATLVRLGDPEAAPRLRPLSEARADLERRLDVRADLAAYAGDTTPCRSALDVVAERLRTARSPGVVQVVFFLSDGACTPAASETPDATAFLDAAGVPEGAGLRFFLLRFAGRAFSPELAALAQATDGAVFEVSGERPTEILAPFADALTRAQGYFAHELFADEPVLPAFGGARRVRVLVVAEGDGPQLEPRLEGASGAVDTLPTHGQHQFENGQLYRYVALEYVPPGESLVLQIDGEDAWRAVAVPEFRLQAHLSVTPGACGEVAKASRTTPDALDTGSDVCIGVELRDPRGRPIESGVFGAAMVEATVYHDGETLENATRMNSEESDRLRFSLSKGKLADGRWVFEARAILGVGARSLEVQATPVALDVSSYAVDLAPQVLDFDVLRAGGRTQARSVKIDGNFPPGSARFVLDGLPACLQPFVDGHPADDPLPVAPGSSHSLELRADRWCGPDALEGVREGALRWRVTLGDDGEAGAREVTRSTAVRVELDYPLRVPEEIVVSVAAGHEARGALPVSLPVDAPLDLVILDAAASANRSEGRAEGMSGDPRAWSDRLEVETSPFRLDPQQLSLDVPVRVRAHACAAAGNYRTRLLVAPADGESTRGAIPRAVALAVTVEDASRWRCWAPTVLRGLAGLGLMLALLYLLSMVRNTRRLDLDALADALVPLRYDAYGSPQADTRSRDERRRFVRRALPLPRRAWAWLRSNPLVFGLPGGLYRETARLDLQPERRLDRSRLRLVERQRMAAIEADPAQAAGTLWARGRPGRPDFVFVPRGRRIGRFVLEDFDAGEADAKPRLQRARRRQRLVRDLDSRDRTDDLPAGWQLG